MAEVVIHVYAAACVRGADDAGHIKFKHTMQGT